MALDMLLWLRSFTKSRRWKSRSSVVCDGKNRPAEEEEEKACALLTVWRKSLVLNCCSGFTVIDCDGSLAYRVDNYRGRPPHLLLMDAVGNCILTLRRRKNLSLVDEWLIYEGDASNDSFQSLTRRHSSSPSSSSPTNKKQTKHTAQKPAYHVKKQLSILQPNSSNNDARNNVLAHVYTARSEAGDQDGDHSRRISRPSYVIEGSYNKRSCRVVDCSVSDGSRKKVVAEIKAKEAINGCASFGLEVFHLIVWPGFDPALAMTLVLLLDQMFG